MSGLLTDNSYIGILTYEIQLLPSNSRPVTFNQLEGITESAVKTSSQPINTVIRHGEIRKRTNVSATAETGTWYTKNNRETFHCFGL